MTSRGGYRAAVSFLGLLWLMMACGGSDSSTAPPVDDDGSSEDGRILVANETAVVLGVAYLREDDPDAPRLVRTEVPPGAVADVSGGGALLPADTQIELDLVLEAVEAGGVRVRRKVSVTVDGEVLVTIRLADPGDPFSAEIEVAAMPASP